MPSHRFTLGVMRQVFLQVCCAFGALSCGIGPPPKQAVCTASAGVAEVAEGVYVRSGHPAVVFEGDDIANIGFIVGDRCVAVVDTGGSAAEGHALDCAIRTLTDRPVCYVINTHVHPDHILGNQAFRRPGVEFVGHAKLPRAMALRGDTYLARASAYEGTQLHESTIVFPERTVQTAVQLDIGGRLLSLRAHGSAHTDHDLSVVDEKTNTAFLGDLIFIEHVPVIDGSINGWIGELQGMSTEPLGLVVAGHGPARAAWPSAARPTLDYLVGLREEVRAWIGDGGDLASAQASIGLARSADWLLFDRYNPRNVGAAYAELEWED